jgi:hypothetical protein
MTTYGALVALADGLAPATHRQVPNGFEPADAVLRPRRRLTLPSEPRRSRRFPV